MSQVANISHDFGPESSSRARPISPVIYRTRVGCAESMAIEKDLVVQIITNSNDQQAAASLINRMYDWRGYGDSHRIPVSDAHSTFLASLDGMPVGTITLAVDTGKGLAADAIFRDEINTFRRMPGASVCELTKFAFDADIPSRKLLASLFHVVFLYGKRKHRCTDLFIEVNPRHRRFYQAMLGFEPIGALKTNESVEAPSQLMWLKVSDIAAQIARLAGREACARSLYPLFLPPQDQTAVLARLSESLPSYGAWLN